MSALAAQWIKRGPQKAVEPPHPDVQKALEVLGDSLTPAGRRAFLRDVRRATKPDAKKDSVRELEQVLAAWYRTYMLSSQPGYDAAVDWSTQEGDAKTLEEISKELQL
jgi:hypothetical protein